MIEVKNIGNSYSPMFLTSIMACLLRVPMRVWTGRKLPSSLYVLSVIGVQSGPSQRCTSAFTGRPVLVSATCTRSLETSLNFQVLRVLPSILWVRLPSGVMSFMVQPRWETVASWPATPNMAMAGRAAAPSAKPPAAKARKVQPSMLLDGASSTATYSKPVAAFGRATPLAANSKPAAVLGIATTEAGACTAAAGSGRVAGEIGRKRRVSARALAITTASMDIGDENRLSTEP